MTVPELLALPDADLDRACAEAMGWESLVIGDYHYYARDNSEEEWNDWRPSRDRDDTATMLEEVERRGLTFKFDMALGDCLNLSDEQPAYYLVANASPRILAACAAWVLRQGKGE